MLSVVENFGLFQIMQFLVLGNGYVLIITYNTVYRYMLSAAPV